MIEIKAEHRAKSISLFFKGGSMYTHILWTYRARLAVLAAFLSGPAITAVAQASPAVLKPLQSLFSAQSATREQAIAKETVRLASTDENPGQNTACSQCEAEYRDCGATVQCKAKRDQCLAQNHCPTPTPAPPCKKDCGGGFAFGGFIGLLGLLNLRRMYRRGSSR